jgi:DNA-binding transcriptional MerR regulator
MRISELARSTGVSLPTVKYYLRGGLLPPGRATAATQADYDSSHADRLRLIRALVDVGGLSLAAVRSVLAVIDSGPDQAAIAVGTVHAALSAGTDAVRDDTGCDAGTRSAPVAPPPERALAVLRQLDWCADPGSPTVRWLDAALDAVEQVGIPMSPERLRAYADAAMTVAAVDVASVPQESAADAVTHVVLGTVLYEPVLLALRRLAQARVFVGTQSQPDGDSSDGDSELVSGPAASAAAGRRPPGPPAA